MRTTLILPMLAILAAFPAALNAGVYNTAEPTEDQLDPSYEDRFHRHLLILRSIGMDKVQVDNPLRRRYVLQDALAVKSETSRLTIEQQINLGAVLIRRNKPDAALRILMPLAAERRQAASVQDLLIQANLATAYFLAGHESRALDHLDAVLDAWPKEWDDRKDTPLQSEWISYGWSEAEFYRFRLAETYLRKLFRSRAREPKEKRMNPQELDTLFEVQFLGDGGEFEPGRIASAEKRKLPRNATDIVQQLINWLPYDDRLYWLLGEVMNAEGRTKAARMIFKELIENRNFRASQAVAHRQKLMEYVEPDAPLPDFPMEAKSDLTPSKEAPTSKDWRSLAIAFGAGVLVTIFGVFQIREIQRRRQRSRQSSAP